MHATQLPPAATAKVLPPMHAAHVFVAPPPIEPWPATQRHTLFDTAVHGDASSVPLPHTTHGWQTVPGEAANVLPTAQPAHVLVPVPSMLPEPAVHWHVRSVVAVQSLTCCVRAPHTVQATHSSLAAYVMPATHAEQVLVELPTIPPWPEIH